MGWIQIPWNKVLKNFSAAILADEASKLRVSADSTKLDSLENLFVAGSNVTLATINPGAAEQIQISASGGGGGGGGGGYNLAFNPSFEMWDRGIAAAPTKWAAIGTAAIARDAGEADGFGGAYAVKITSGGAGNEGIIFTFKGLKPSTQYAVGVRGKATAGDTAKIWTTGAGTNLDQSTTKTVPTAIASTFTTDATPTDVVMKIGSDNNGDIVWFDQLQINEGADVFPFVYNRRDDIRLIFQAGSFEFPNASYAVNYIAPMFGADGWLVHRFGETATPGVGFMVKVPTWAKWINFNVIGYAETAPAVAKGVTMQAYFRMLPENAATPAWSAAQALTSFAIPTNAYWQRYSQKFAIASGAGNLDLTPGNYHLFEMARNAADGGDNLVGNFNLKSIEVQFS